jgi:hypothetical protein
VFPKNVAPTMTKSSDQNDIKYSSESYVSSRVGLSQKQKSRQLALTAES